MMQKTFGINPKECILCHSEMELAYRKIGANAAFFMKITRNWHKEKGWLHRRSQDRSI
ncbi:protein of unknown function (plasmid) [Legionella pneumophila subsp. pneumophila]|uniref:Uncharacterized protein n=1 Tax=Legionella pneumophila subsp. pneumophila TaxID=91891 RepID=A0AAV2V1W5_LEGPN|nr:protein of unknown function [Legionella pneumophila subsp. pneumophila]